MQVAYFGVECFKPSYYLNIQIITSYKKKCLCLLILQHQYYSDTSNKYKQCNKRARVQEFSALSDVGKALGFKANGQGRVLGSPLVQKG